MRKILLARNPKKAFTLVEMMMVMGILAIIIALGVPIYSMMAMGKSLGGAGDIFTGLFLKYREMASAKGQPIFLMLEHWHMNKNLPPDHQTPPVLKAFQITKNTTSNSWNFIEMEQTKLPKNVWFNDNWVENKLPSYSPISPTVPYANEANALCSQFYKMSSAPNPWEKKPYLIIFLPNGALVIIGRANVSGVALEETPPDADIWLTNGVDTLLIDLNPNTGRIKKRRLSDVVK